MKKKMINKKRVAKQMIKSISSRLRIEFVIVWILKILRKENDWTEKESLDMRFRKKGGEVEDLDPSFFSQFYFLIN